jgi:hypothetical protein
LIDCSKDFAILFLLLQTENKKKLASAKYVNIPIMSDKKCSKKWSKATRKSRMCTSARDEKLICDVCSGFIDHPYLLISLLKY